MGTPPSHARIATYHDVIFSCSVCQATLSEIYKNPESAQGLRDGHSPLDRVVTKLWLTECAHLTCSRHLEGGGVPFHPDGQQPEAPCPFCQKDSGNVMLQKLYAIRGLDDYDHKIPKTWFDIPPVRLDGSMPGMEALRFHYLSLLRFSTETHYKIKEYKKLLDEALTGAEAVSKALDLSNEEIATLKDEVERMTGYEAELKRYKAKDPAIKHYLAGYTKLATENQGLRAKLRDFGYSIPMAKYAHPEENEGRLREPPISPGGAQALERDLARISNDSKAGTQENGGHHMAENNHIRPVKPNGWSSKNPIAGKSALIDRATSRSNVFEAAETQSSKRKRTESSYDTYGAFDSRQHEFQTRIESREEMPPPMIPLSRIAEESPKRLPVSRSEVHRSGIVQRQRSPELQIFDGDQWQSLNESNRAQNEEYRARGNGVDSRTQVIDMGLQVPPSPQLRHVQSDSRLGEYARTDVNAPFKSPIRRQDRPLNSFQKGDFFPNSIERSSYLTEETPRGQVLRPDSRYEHRSFQQSTGRLESASRNNQPSDDDDRGTFFQQHDPPRDEQPLTRNDHGIDHHFPRSSYGLSNGVLNPRTPAPKGTNINQLNSVTSPFFESTRGINFTRRPRHMASESQLYRATVPDVIQGYKMAQAHSLHVAEPRSLNGLSFIDSPQDSKNAPISVYDTRAPISDPRLTRPSFVGTNTRSTQGFFTRPDTDRSNYAQRDAFPPSSRHSFAQQPNALPSIMPPTIPSRSASRSSNRYPNDGALMFGGAKSGGASSISGRRPLNHSRSHASLNQPNRGIFSSYGGMRSVKR